MSTPTTVRCLATLRLLDALRGHLAATGLPEPASVEISPGNGEITVQPAVADYTNPAARLGGLLLWTHRLTGLSARWQRVPDGEDVHVSITGRLPGGHRIRLYKNVPYVAVWDLVYLDPGADESVTLDELHWLASQLRTTTTTAAA